MAHFNVDFRGIAFESATETLRSAYASAEKGLAGELVDLDREIDAYDEHGVWIGERDDDGNTIWEQGQVFELRKEMVNEARSDLRKAFALAAYHHWERAARQWTGFHGSGHEKLVARVEKAAITTHPRLVAIRDLANAVKHNVPKIGAVLLASWPDVFPPGFTAPRWGDWYAAISLTDDQVNEVFDIVLASGPKAIPAAAGTRAELGE